MLDTERKKQEYQSYIDEITPKKKMVPQLAKAFLTGGIICVLGQGIMQLLQGYLSLEEKQAATYTSIILIFLSIILTSFQIYGKIAAFGGAGALVPITGFANGVCASAIEYKAQGQVFGVGCKIFTIAGPVILYGIFTSWVLGLIIWIIGLFG